MQEVNEFLATDRGKDQETRQTQDAFDLLTLVNQSYQALDIGRLESIDDLRRAVEDVDSVKKHFTARNSPSDTDSFGLASAINPDEELETYVRMVSFFNKRKPERGICWELFEIAEGTLQLKSESEIAAQELQIHQQEAVVRVIKALEKAEALGLEIFSDFESAFIYRDQRGYHAKI